MDFRIDGLFQMDCVRDLLSKAIDLSRMEKWRGMEEEEIVNAE
jgi:hypothetical protein